MNIIAQKYKNNNLIIALISIFISFALFLDYNLVQDDAAYNLSQNAGYALNSLMKVAYSAQLFTVSGIFVVMLSFIILKYSFNLEKAKCHEIILGISIAFTCVLGRCFEEFGTTSVLAHGLVQSIKSLIIITGYSIFFVNLIKVAKSYISKNFKFENGFDIDNPVLYRRIIFVFIVIIWSVTFIAFYPGVFQGDTDDIIYMSYNYYTGLADSVVRISQDNVWVDHHSVVYTVLLGAFVKFGRAVAGDENIGIMLYTLCQGLFTAWVLAYSVFKLKKYGVNSFWRTCFVGFYAFFPWIPRYALMATKDTLFADMLLLFILVIADIVIENKEQIGFIEILKLVIYSVLAFLLRKNGLYVMLLSVPFLLVINKKWFKQICIIILCIFIAKFIYSDVVLKTLEIPDGSISAALTIPLQQTSRYLHYYPDEVTEEEKSAIDGVVYYDKLSSCYEANRSDHAKSCWRKESGKEELIAYLNVWMKMLLKHPLTYVAATANSNHGYFYPVVMELSDFEISSIGSYQTTNRDGLFEFKMSDSKISKSASDILRVGDSFFERIPVLNLLCTSALYVWILICVFTKAIIYKDNKMLAIAFPILMLMLTIISGPCNGNVYHRFTFPVALCIPIVAGFGLKAEK